MSDVGSSRPIIIGSFDETSVWTLLVGRPTGELGNYVFVVLLGPVPSFSTRLLTGRQWFEESVVVRRDGEGYGITLAEAQPVFIQGTVKSGPADRAGVCVGDRIVKVNGQSIMNKTHAEVVDMVRNSSFVSFTLMRKVQDSWSRDEHNGDKAKATAGNGFTPLAQQNKISGVNSAFSLQNLKTILKKERSAYEKLAVQFSKTHSEALVSQIMNHQLAIQGLEQEIAAQSPSINSHIKATQASVASLRGHHRSPSDSWKVTTNLMEQELQDSSTQDLPRTLESPTRPVKVAIGDGSESHTVVPSPSLSVPVSSSSKPGRFWKSFSNDHKVKTHVISAPIQPSAVPKSPPHQAGSTKDATMDISPISSDDEDSMNITEGVSPFQSLQVLRSAPAHMSTFLCYMLGMKNKDPKKLCFYLVLQSYQELKCKPSEMKQRAVDIYITFLHPNSPLYLDLGEKHEAMASRILNTIQTEELVMKLIPVFREVRGVVQQSIESDLSEYQNKRLIGLGWMFGDQKLGENMSQEDVVEVTYSTLQAPLRDLMEDFESKDLRERNRIMALTCCIATFLLDVGRPKSKSSEPPNLDKLPSLTKCDVRKMKQKRKPELRQGHQLQPAVFSTPAVCEVCEELIWAVGLHGMQCSHCEVSVHHAEECMSDIAQCVRDKRKKFAKIKGMSDYDSYCEDLEERQAEWENGGGRTISSPDIRSPVSKERSLSEIGPEKRQVTALTSHSLTTENPPIIPAYSGEIREKVHVSRTLSEKLPEKPHPPGRFKHFTHDNSMPVSQSTTSFPGLKHHNLDDLRRGSGTQLSPLPEIVKTSPIDVEVEIDLQDRDLVVTDELIPWATMVGKEVVSKYNKCEKQRQELIREFVHTERTHLKKLKVMLYLYKKPLIRQKIISYERVLQLFPNLEELIMIHGILLTDLKSRESENGEQIVKGIADILLQRFSGEAGERLKKAGAVFASNQAMAVMLFKRWKENDERFRDFVRVSESHAMCGRLTLAELLPIPWTRLTKYRLLIEGLLGQYRSQAKKIGPVLDEEKKEWELLEAVLSSVKVILQDVNVQVKSSENHCKLLEYQAKLDTSLLEKSTNNLAHLYRNLEIAVEGRELLHEGPLTWQLQNKKIELHGLLLTDILVLMEKDMSHDRFFLRTHTQTDLKGQKEEHCPVIKISETLWRDSATDRAKRTFFLANNSPLMKYALKYELLAESATKKERWRVAFESAASELRKAPQPPPEADALSIQSNDTVLSPLQSPTPTSSPTLGSDPASLYRIDESIVKLLEEKMATVKAMSYGAAKESSFEGLESPTGPEPLEPSTPLALARAAIEQACIMVSAANAFLVPDMRACNFSTAQIAIAEHAVTLQRHLTTLMGVLSSSSETAEVLGNKRDSTQTLVASMNFASLIEEEKEEETEVAKTPCSQDVESPSNETSVPSTACLDPETSQDNPAALEDLEDVPTTPNHTVSPLENADDDERKLPSEQSREGTSPTSGREEDQTQPPSADQPDGQSEGLKKVGVNSSGERGCDGELEDLPPPPPQVGPPESPLFDESGSHFPSFSDSDNSILIAQLLASESSQTSLGSYHEDDMLIIPPPLFGTEDVKSPLSALLELPVKTASGTVVTGSNRKVSNRTGDDEDEDSSPPPLPPSAPPPPIKCTAGDDLGTDSLNGSLGFFAKEQGSSEA
nr:Rho guanine nucleotide exchange factor 12 [Halisarca dujardinii]